MVVEGSQAGGIELAMEDSFSFAEVEGGSLLGAVERGWADFVMQSGE